MEFDIVNVVGTVNYEQELDLRSLAEEFSNREEIESVVYEPSKAHWLQTRFSPDDTYVAFYRSGKCTIAGGDSINHFNSVSERVNKVMAELLGFEYEPKVKVRNIVATSDLGSPILLEGLTLEIGMEHVEYEPEQFPALMYRKSDHVILVFSSGKILLTGLVSQEDVSEAIERFKEEIQGLI